MSEIFLKGLLKAINKMIDFLLSALAERKGRLSIGRLLLISIFILAMIKWSAGLDLPSTMLSILISLLSYVMGTKVVSTITGVIQNNAKNGETNINTSVSSTVNSSVDKEKDGGKKTPDIE
jgi:hypothetical protein